MENELEILRRRLADLEGFKIKCEQLEKTLQQSEKSGATLLLGQRASPTWENRKPDILICYEQTIFGDMLRI